MLNSGQTLRTTPQKLYRWFESLTPRQSSRVNRPQIFVRKTAESPQKIESSQASLFSRRSFCRLCLDWTERRPHIAGPLGAAITQRFFDLGWIERMSRSHVVVVTPLGRRGLKEVFGVDASQLNRTQQLRIVPSALPRRNRRRRHAQRDRKRDPRQQKNQQARCARMCAPRISSPEQQRKRAGTRPHRARAFAGVLPARHQAKTLNIGRA